MKSLKKSGITCIFLFSAISFFTASAQVTLQKVWETDTLLTTPESVFYHPGDKTLYISCINGMPRPENQNSFIAKIDLNGKITKLKLTEQLNATKGIAVSGNKIYVTEIFKLVEIDLKSGKVLNKYEVPEAVFLNDVTVDHSGKVVYFTDMRSNRIWKLDQGKIVKVAEGAPLTNPNGLFFHKGSLLVGNGDGKVLSLNLKDNSFSTIASGMEGLDGITPDGKGGYFASEWRGKVWHISPEGKTQLLLDFVNEKINTADFEYIPEQKLLIIPTFLKNKVIAYRVQ